MKFTANNTNITQKINNFNIIQSFDNIESGFFEFYFNEPHRQTDGSFINISDSENYNLDKNLFPNIIKGSSSVRLRPQIRIGITATMKYKWRYIDNSNEWIDISGSGVLPQYKDTLYTIGIGGQFAIQFGNIGGYIVVKEQHSTQWQQLINAADVSRCGTWSDHSIIASTVIEDTYLRVSRFNLYRTINIRNRGFDNCGKYYFFTDYGLDTIKNMWFDHLYTSPCDCQKICVIMGNTPWWDLIPGTLRDDIPGSADCNVDPPPPNPDGIYGGPPQQGIENNEPPCTEVSIMVYKHCDDIYEPICANKIDILKTANADYSFSILDNIEYDNVKEIRKYTQLNCLRMWADATSFQVGITLDSNFSISLGKDDGWNTKFIEDEKAKSINPIVDNERIQFEPFWKNGDGSFTKINHIKYQLVFLNEKPNTWTDELNPPQNPTAWKNLGFTDDDIKYQKARLRKCFLRLSYYDGQNPSQHLLEHYNTVFVDSNMMYSDFVYGINNISGLNYNTTPITKFRDPYTGEYTDGFRTTFHVYNPYIKTIERVPPPNVANVYRKDGPFVMNYSNSSDGFYIYLYDPSINKRCNPQNSYWDSIPNSLYMKLEFNNASSGKRTLFFNDKNKSGVEMNNVFFDQGHVGYIWTKIWVEYNQGLDKFIWYPDPTYPNVKQDTKNKDTIVLNFYEAYVR